MNKRMAFIGLFLFVNVAFAQESTLNKIGFANVYSDINLIQTEFTDSQNKLSHEECVFLSDTVNSLDQKMAFINALTPNDTTLITVYCDFLASKYQLEPSVFDSLFSWRGNLPVEYLPAKKLSADDYSCLAYLNLIGQSKYPLQSYYCAFRGVDLNPGSEAAAYIYGLVMAEHYLKMDWCKVFETMKSIQTFDAFTTDRIREAAIRQIFEEINKYESACKGGPNPPLDYLKSTNVIDDKKEPCYIVPPFKQKKDGEDNYAELQIVKWGRPQYTHENRGTKLVLTIKNTGTLSSIETNALFSDLDITIAEAKQLKCTKTEVELISENNSRSVGEGKWVKKGVDDDEDWSVCVKIPVLQPGEEFDLVMVLKEIWVINPVCEIQVELDADNNIEEKSEQNNKSRLITKNGY